MPEENEPTNGQALIVTTRESKKPLSLTPAYRRACADLGINEIASKGSTNLAILGQADFEIGPFDINAGCLTWQRTEMFKDLQRLEKILNKETEPKAIIAIIKARAVLQKQIADNVRAMSHLSVSQKAAQKPAQEPQATWKPGQVISPTPIQINVSGGKDGGGSVEIKTVESKEIES